MCMWMGCVQTHTPYYCHSYSIPYRVYLVKKLLNIYFTHKKAQFGKLAARLQFGKLAAQSL